MRSGSALLLGREKSGTGTGKEIGNEREIREIGNGSGIESGKGKGRRTEIIRSLNGSAIVTCTICNSSQRDTDTLPHLININMYTLSLQVTRIITLQDHTTTTARTIITWFITTTDLDNLKEVPAGTLPHLCRLEAQDPYTVLEVLVNTTLLAVRTHNRSRTPTLHHNHNHTPTPTPHQTNILPRLSISRRQNPLKITGRATTTLPHRYRLRRNTGIGIERGIYGISLLESRGDPTHVQ
jgi:hypothetical protein